MRRITLGIAAGALAIGGFFASPAGAAKQEGLVNVYADDTTVQIPIGVAANVCGVAVNVLSQAADIGSVECSADGVAMANDSNNGNQNVNQKGLVNVALVDTTVQVPVAVAANICAVDVNVLARSLHLGAVDCDALAESNANG